ncbi:TetR/AcrR family transcriptional regulator [Kineococcus endophyticus]|uniref:TetR/AcrR family transcriptional regulator n=1 Tax=Kineococcus endophyticus TaxID=1181883 RepID=A0ABV3PBR3_9ACTN
MPRLVDHTARRREIIHVTWRLVARHGLDSVTMRDIAAEAGYANGALNRYFAGKDELLQASFEYVFAQTNDRVAAAIGDRRGLDALRAFCLEVLPLDETRVLEARIVVSFWGRTVADDRFAGVNAVALREWRTQVVGWLQEARRAGDVPPTVDADLAAAHLLAFLMGAQTFVVAEEPLLTPHQQRAALDAHLAQISR